MNEVIIRPVVLEDAGRLLEIYRYYVENTAISWECTLPTEEEFRGRVEKTLQSYPYLCITEDGVIQGYSYAGPFVGREAYRYSVELTIYLANGEQGKGYGRRLYAAIEQELADKGIHNLYACIGYPEVEDEYLTRNSVDFHRHMGFTLAGMFQNCGCKFDRWYHMVWMEKIISPANMLGMRYRRLESRHDTALAELIRYNLKEHQLDIPGTVYFDENLYHLSEYYLDRPDARSYMILEDAHGQLIGGVGVAEFAGIEGCAELQKLYLADEAKGSGLGYQLIQLAEREAGRLGYKRIYLETHDHLQAAIHIYEKSGYQQIDRPACVVHGTMNRFYLKELPVIFPYKILRKSCP